MKTNKRIIIEDRKTKDTWSFPYPKSVRELQDSYRRVIKSSRNSAGSTNNWEIKIEEFEDYQGEFADYKPENLVIKLTGVTLRELVAQLPDPLLSE